MYATNEERIQIARAAWEQADSALQALIRKLRKAELAASKLDGAAYAAACSEAALIRVQYVAVANLAADRWAHFKDVAEI